MAVSVVGHEDNTQQMMPHPKPNPSGVTIKRAPLLVSNIRLPISTR